MKWTAQRYTPTFGILDLQNYPPSVANLPPGLYINGQTVYPTFRYNGRDATATTWPAWGYGETLTLQAGTAPTYNNGSPLLGSVDDSVKFNAGGYYKADNNALGDITTEDFVDEMVFTLQPASATVAYAGKNPDNNGVHWYSTGTSIIWLIGSGGSIIQPAATVAYGSVMHVIAFGDKSGSAVFYVNGVASTAYDFSALGSLSVAAPLAIGARTGGTLANSGNVMYYARYIKANWLDAHLQATVAKTRFAQLTGVYPQTARGTALPTVMTRSTAGYLDKIEADGTTKLYYVGANWPRVCSRKDTNGNIVRGYLSETAGTNILTLSTTLGSWAAGKASISATAVVLPDGTTGTANVIRDTADDGFHYIARSGGGTNTAARVISVFAKAINGTWGYALTDGGKSCYFNCATGAIGTAAGMVGVSQNCGNGWWKFTFYVAAWIAGSDFYIALANADNTVNYTGDATDRLAVWLPQIELGNVASSSIPTAAAAVTRTADSLRYVMDDGNLTAGKGSVTVDFMGPNIDQSGIPVYATISDGTVNNRIGYGACNAGDDTPFMFLVSGGAAQIAIQGTTDIWNGNKHTLRATWKTNQARQYVDGAVDGTEDTVCTVPTGLTQLDVGAYLSAGYESNGLLSNLRIYGGVTTKG
jgi:hypothetical protein